ncbi:MAG: hypothetical protein M0Z43_02275 [Acidithiobacillus sp.]|nr:hypothetical protein [Acidithiobacillus sp.]
MNSGDFAKETLDVVNGYGHAQAARVEPKLCRRVVGDEDPEHKGLIRYTLGGVDYTKEIAPPGPPQPDQLRVAPNIVCESKTAAALRAQREAAGHLDRYRCEALQRAGLIPSDPLRPDQMRNQQDLARDYFVWAPARPTPKTDPTPLTFTTLQETVLPDLYGKKQYVQLLAAAKKREAEATARLREETNRKIGGLLRGFLGARREEEL